MRRGRICITIFNELFICAAKDGVLLADFSEANDLSSFKLGTVTCFSNDLLIKDPGSLPLAGCEDQRQAH